MRRDPKIFYMSTDALPPLLKEFGDQRVRATPITEAALTGMAIGAAGSGFRPIVDWRQVTFSLCRDGPDRQSGREDPLHVRRPGDVPDPVSRVGRRRRPGRGAALAVALFDVHECRRAEDVPAVDALRHEGPAEDGDPRQQPGHLVRVEPADGAQGAGAGGGLHDPARRGRRQARGQRRDGRRARLAGARGARRGRGARQGGDLGRGRRSAHAGAAGRGDDPQLGAEDRPARHRRRGGADRRLLGGDRRACHRGRRDIRAAEGAGEAGLRLAGADPLQPRARKPRLPGPQPDHRRHPRGACRRSPPRRRHGSPRRRFDPDARSDRHRRQHHPRRADEAAGAVVVNASHGGDLCRLSRGKARTPPRRSSTMPGSAATAPGSAASITCRNSASPPRRSATTRRGSATAPT